MSTYSATLAREKRKQPALILRRTPTIFVRTSTERPKRLTRLFGSRAEYKHTFTLLSDGPYNLNISKKNGHRVTFRNHLRKGKLSKVMSMIPKALHTYNRAAYVHSFEIDPLEADTSRLYRMQTPEVVEAQRVASYDPLLLSIPIEVIVALVASTIWLWNRERFSLRRAKRERIRNALGLRTLRFSFFRFNQGPDGLLQVCR